MGSLIKILLSTCLLITHFVGIDKNDAFIIPSFVLLSVSSHGFFKCMAKGPIKWNHMMSGLPDNVVEIPERSQLVFPSVNMLNEGVYSCYGRDPLTGHAIIASAKLKVKSKTPKITKLLVSFFQ